MANKLNLTFLGTSAQIPTVKRNHSAILINYDKENILIDCGEGTQRQFRIAKLNPCKVTRILLTHSHGDHVFGLLGLLSTLSVSEYNKTLFIYGPKGIKKFLERFLEGIQFNYKVEIEEVHGKFLDEKDFYLEAERMKHGTPTNAYSFIVKDKLRIDKKKLEKSGIKDVKLLKDISLGKDVVFEGKKYLVKNLTYLEKGRKISVVLDTLDNERIASFVEGADLFVCESSFGSDLKNMAKEHMHMTSEQAGKIAKKAKVGKLLLTHISQRYEIRKKFLLEDAKKSFEDVKIVKDFDSFEV